MKNTKNTIGSSSQITIYETEDGKARISVRFENENVWLTQKLMAELFECSVDNVSLHLKNIFAERELERDSVVEEYSITAADGKSYKKADKILMNFGAQETQLQIKPKKSITGEYMKLKIYALLEKPYVVINHEEENGISIIKTMSLYYIRPDSKKNSQGRKWEDVVKIDLNKLEIPDYEY